MKALLIVFLISVQVLLGATTGTALTTIIYDYDSSPDGANTYYGGTANGSAFVNQDLIGSDLWAIKRMEVTDDGTAISVKIVGRIFSNGWDRLNLGDLYISSTGWSADSKTGHNVYDTFKLSEGWNYVVGTRPGYWDYQHLTPKNTPTWVNPVMGVYKLDVNATGIDQFWMSNVKYGTGQGRFDQAFSGGYGEFVEYATIGDPYIDLINPDESYMTFTFNKFLSGNIGFHWTMYCGNDVIEGKAALVPEPGTLLLFGLGLVGVAVCRRKKKLSK